MYGTMNLSWIDKLVNRQMSWWIDEQIPGWMDGWMDGWIIK